MSPDLPTDRPDEQSTAGAEEQQPPPGMDPEPARAPQSQPESGIDLAKAALSAARAAAAKRGLAAPAERKAKRAAASTRSGAGPDDRDPQPLGQAIGRLLTDRGWETDAAVGGVMGRWTEIVGAELAAHCQPESYTDGELVVIADSTAWATQLRYLAPQLVRALNTELGHGVVKAVVVKGPTAPSWRKGRRSAPGSRGPRDTYGRSPDRRRAHRTDN